MLPSNNWKVKNNVQEEKNILSKRKLIIYAQTNNKRSTTSEH